MKKVFDEEYKERFVAKGLLERCGGNLQHLISDAATMQLIRWTDGGFGMAAHNYDGDMCKSNHVYCVDATRYIHMDASFISCLSCYTRLLQ